MSARSQKFALERKAKRAQAEQAAQSNPMVLHIIESVSTDVMITSDLPDAGTIDEMTGEIRGASQEFIDMLPAWSRFVTPPTWYTRRAKNERGEIINILDVKGWRKERNAAYTYAASGDAPIVKVVRDGTTRRMFDIPIPCTIGRLLALIDAGNMHETLRAARGLIKAAKSFKDAMDEDGEQIFSDTYQDVGGGILVSPAMMRIAYAASDVASTRAAEDKAQRAYYDADSLSAGRKSDTLERATAKRLAAESAFHMAWAAIHTVALVPVAPAPVVVDVKSTKAQRKVSNGTSKPRKTRAQKTAEAVAPVVAESVESVS